jgi:hypothetical protein
VNYALSHSSKKYEIKETVPEEKIGIWEMGSPNVMLGNEI